MENNISEHDIKLFLEFLSEVETRYDKHYMQFCACLLTKNDQAKLKILYQSLN
jgi:hypothetical protein